MRKIIFACLILCSFSLAGCTHILKPYRPPVQQGNVITHKMMQQLKIGMTKNQVTQIFGTPVLRNTLDPNTWIYVYTFQASKGPRAEKKLTIHFRHGLVSSFLVGLPAPQIH